MCLDFDDGECGHTMKNKCIYIAHAGIPYWDHRWSKYVVGKKCQCGARTWTSEDAEQNQEAWETIATDSNLNRM